MDETKKCTQCNSDCYKGEGILDQTSGAKKTTTWTCSAGCGYKRWDPIPPEAR